MASSGERRASRRLSGRLESAAAELALLRRGESAAQQLGGTASADDVQKLGDYSQRRDRCIIEPDSVVCKCWYFVLLCAIVWSTFAVPFQISFAPPTLGIGQTWWSLLVADIVLGLDIAVSLNRGFYNEELAYKVVERRLIQRRYVMNVWDFSHPSLARDLLSLVPLNLFEGQMGGLRGATRLPRLLRTPRIFSLLREIGDKPLGKNTVRMVQVGIIAIMMAHLVACIWYAFGLIDGFGTNAWLPGEHLAPDAKKAGLRYLACLYHGLGMMVGVVDGGEPESAAQNIFHVSIMIAALLLFAYSIGVVSAGTEDKNQRALQFESRLKYVQLVLRSHQLPAPLVARVMGFLSYQNHHQDDFDLRIIDELPENLQADLMGRIVRRCVARLPLFRKVAEEEGLLATLATRFEHCVFMPREVMMCRGVFIDRLFVLVRGEALQVGGRLRSQWDAQQREQQPRAFARPQKERLQAGDMCGEEMLTGEAPLHTVVALTSIECFALRRQQMQTVLRYFPQAQAQFPHLAALNSGGGGGGGGGGAGVSSCGTTPCMLRPGSSSGVGVTPRPGSSPVGGANETLPPPATGEADDAGGAGGAAGRRLSLTLCEGALASLPSVVSSPSESPAVLKPPSKVGGPTFPQRPPPRPMPHRCLPVCMCACMRACVSALPTEPPARSHDCALGVARFTSSSLQAKSRFSHAHVQGRGRKNSGSDSSDSGRDGWRRRKNSGTGSSDAVGGIKSPGKSPGRRRSCCEMAAATVAAAASTAMKGAMIGSAAGSARPGSAGGDGLEDDEDFLAGVHRARSMSERGADRIDGVEEGSHPSHPTSQVRRRTSAHALLREGTPTAHPLLPLHPLSSHLAPPSRPSLITKQLSSSAPLARRNSVPAARFRSLTATSSCADQATSFRKRSGGHADRAHAPVTEVLAGPDDLVGNEDWEGAVTELRSSLEWSAARAASPSLGLPPERSATSSRRGSHPTLPPLSRLATDAFPVNAPGSPRREPSPDGWMATSCSSRLASRESSRRSSRTGTRRNSRDRGFGVAFLVGGGDGGAGVGGGAGVSGGACDDAPPARRPSLTQNAQQGVVEAATAQEPSPPPSPPAPFASAMTPTTPTTDAAALARRCDELLALCRRSSETGRPVPRGAWLGIEAARGEDAAHVADVAWIGRSPPPSPPPVEPPSPVAATPPMPPPMPPRRPSLKKTPSEASSAGDSNAATPTLPSRPRMLERQDVHSTKAAEVALATKREEADFKAENEAEEEAKEAALDALRSIGAAEESCELRWYERPALRWFAESLDAAHESRRLRVPLVQPDAWLRTLWLGVLLAAQVCCGLTLGYRWGFVEVGADDPAWIALDVACDLVFWASLALSFRLPFAKGDSTYVTEPLAIAARYVCSRHFLLDVLAVMPSFALSLSTRYAQPLYRLPLLVQVLRTPWLVDALWRRLTIADAGFSMRRLAVICYTFMLASHLCACAWAAVQRWEYCGTSPDAPERHSAKCTDDAPHGFVAYTHGLWWAVTALTALGTLTTPSTDLQLGFGALVFCGSLVTSIYIIGNMSVLISNLDAVAVHFRKRQKIADSFVQRQALPEVLARRLHMYQRIAWIRGAGCNLERVVELVNPSIRADVMKHICESIFTRLPFFERCGPKFIEVLYSSIRLEVFPLNEWVCRKGSISSALYIVMKGAVSIVINEAKMVVVARLHRGDFFGERSLFAAEEKRNASVRAHTTVELVVLQASHFRKVLAAFPEVEQQMLEAKNQREAETAAAAKMQAQAKAAEEKRTSLQSNQSRSSMRSSDAGGGAPTSADAPTRPSLCPSLSKRRLSNTVAPAPVDGADPAGGGGRLSRRRGSGSDTLDNRMAVELAKAAHAPAPSETSAPSPRRSLCRIGGREKARRGGQGAAESYREPSE